ncbi:MAG: hypothetical protein QOJ79_390 [Actinomycetota bacterium]|jgi:predicted ATPase/DNA-binding CsgD family transcriptional regulator|nr:hypothetical protein [Actinomycetota bacterium]
MADTVLPLPATRLFGRDDELRLVAELLADSRLVTLTGAGGCGKTRLALTVANERAGQYDEVCWVDLAAITDPALVPKAVGAALHLADRPGADPVDWLVSAVTDRVLLLVLDNCEHLVDVCADLVSRLLRGCPQLTVLATSREPLGVEGETSYRVPSLAVPPAGAIDLQSYAAVALFADRAAKAKPGFAVTADTGDAVAEICRQLDGIPLALELAAPRVRMMTPSQIASGLGDRFQLLTGGVRTAMPRQRTLEASVAWSYDLLSQDERWVLRQLAVFSGSFALEGALGVCAAGPPQLLDILGRLVERSLLQVDDAGPVARYRLLETVRAYVLGRLIEADEVAAARDRHLDAYVALAAAAEADIQSPAMQRALDDLDAEVDNLRAAMDWASTTGDPAKALRIAGSLWIYWFIRTRHDEGLRRLRGLLDVASDADPRLRFKVLLATMMLLMTTDWRAARPLADEACRIADEVGDDGMRAQALAWVAQAEFQLGGAGLPYMAESLRLARETGDPTHIGRGLQWLGTALGLTGQPAEGIAMLDESITIFRTSGPVQLGWALVWRGVVAHAGGDLRAALPFLSEGYELLAARHEDAFSPVALAELAHIDMKRGALDDARLRLQQARETARRSVTPMTESHIAAVQSLLHIAEGDYAAAFETASRSYATMSDTGSFLIAAQVLSEAGYAAMRMGDLTRARAELERALPVAVNNPAGRGRALWVLAQLTELEGGHAAALDHAHDALRLAHAAHDLILVIDVLWALAELLADEDPAMATRLLGAAGAIAKDIGYVRFPSYQEQDNDVVRRLRGALGADYDDASADGARLSVDDAIGYASRGRGPRQRPSVGWDSLTPMERHVAALVAKGLSNPDIAAQLFVSRNTVKAHLAHAYAKLGVANRSELAAQVSRRDLTQDIAQA